MHPLDKFLALAFSLMILGQAYLVRRFVGTWLFPACMFGLFWFALTFIPLVLLPWTAVNPYAVGFIFLCMALFSLSSIFFQWKGPFQCNLSKPNPSETYGSNFLLRLFYLCGLASITFFALDWFGQGFSVHDLLHEIQESALAYASALYSDDITTPVHAQLGLVFAFLASALGGLLLSTMEGKRKWILVVAAFIPPLFVAIAETTKGPIFLCITFFYGGLLTYRLSTGNTALFQKFSTRRVVPIVLIVTAVITFATLSRHPQKETETATDILVLQGASYCCAHVYAFSDWFSATSGLGRSDTTYSRNFAPPGFYTFMAVYNFAGYHPKVPMGIFDDYYTSDLLSSNIYTMFRGLIIDFGLFGALGWMFIFGVVCHYAFQKMLSAKLPVFTVAFFVFMLASFYNSFIVSAFDSKRFYLAFVLLWTILHINKKFITSPRAKYPARPFVDVPTEGVPRFEAS